MRQNKGRRRVKNLPSATGSIMSSNSQNLSKYSMKSKHHSSLDQADKKPIVILEADDKGDMGGTKKSKKKSTTKESNELLENEEQKVDELMLATDPSQEPRAASEGIKPNITIPKLHVMAAAGGKAAENFFLHDEPLPYQNDNLEALRRKDKHQKKRKPLKPSRNAVSKKICKTTTCSEIHVP